MAKFPKNNSGYALIETLFYIALLVILSIAVINSIITMTRAFKETAIHAELMQGGVILERISREVRQADGVVAISPTTLELASTDAGGAPKSVEFVFSGGNIELWENDISRGFLNTSNIIVGNVVFSQIITAEGEAVKIFLTISSSHDALGRSADYYNTVALRGIYAE